MTADRHLVVVPTFQTWDMETAKNASEGENSKFPNIIFQKPLICMLLHILLQVLNLQ
jgi:hypothetical protein